MVTSATSYVHHTLNKSLLLAGVLSLLVVGCGKSEHAGVAVHPAVGKVVFRGKPAAGAIVALHPKDKSSSTAPNPRASVQHDGSFALSTFRPSDGAPEGTYILTVQWFRPVDRNGDLVPGPNVLPRKYATAKTSGIEVKIASGANELAEIQLR